MATETMQMQCLSLKTMQIWSWKKNVQKSDKNQFGEGFETVLGFLWVLLAASWPFFKRSKSNFFQALAQNGLQEGFWMDFGSLWEGFGKVWGRFGENFRRILDLLSKQGPDFGNAWHDFALLGQIL